MKHNPTLVARYRRLLDLREQQSGVPLKDFCRRYRISIWTYYFWRKELSKPVLSTVPTFVTIRPERPSLFSDSAYTILFPNGIMVRSTAALTRQALEDISSVERRG
jgi:hypothetical protein